MRLICRLNNFRVLKRETDKTVNSSSNFKKFARREIKKWALLEFENYNKYLKFE